MHKDDATVRIFIHIGEKYICFISNKTAFEYRQTCEAKEIRHNIKIPLELGANDSV